MARKRSPRQQKLMALLLAPVNWLEERSGLVGAVKYFLFRRVPARSNWFHTLGSATLTAFLIPRSSPAWCWRCTTSLSGRGLRLDPGDPEQAHLGWLVGMQWGAVSSIILLFLHMSVFLFGVQCRTELAPGVILLTLASPRGSWATSFRGTRRLTGPPSSPSTSMPTRRSWVPSSATSFVAGRRSGDARLARFYSLHMLVIPGGLALITLHLYLVIRLGVTEPPWTRAAAGLRLHRGQGRAGAQGPRSGATARERLDRRSDTNGK